MADFPALPIWTDAYLADTTGLSAEEHGVYLLLLMTAWRSTDCALPDDDGRLARMARVGTKKWQKMRPVMEQFFTVDDRGWTQKRLLKERKRAETLRTQKREAANARWLKENETGDAAASKSDKRGASYPDPNPNNSVPNGTGTDGAGDDEEDLKARLFGPCLQWLGKQTGKPPDSYRSLMGRWIKQSGEGAVLQAFHDAWREKPVSPVDWLAASLNRPRDGPSEPLDFERARAQLLAEGE